MSEYDIVIIGGGPAGLTAGLYASRAGLKSLLLERGAWGGQMINARVVENYPGFPNGIAGIELGSLMQEQASKFGLQTVFAEVSQLAPGPKHRIVTTEDTFEAGAIVVAAGAQYRRLNVPGEMQFLGRGVSYCAACDGFFFRDRDVAVVGGGDTAVSDALELSHYAQKVYRHTSTRSTASWTGAGAASLRRIEDRVHLEYRRGGGCRRSDDELIEGAQCRD